MAEFQSDNVIVCLELCLARAARNVKDLVECDNEIVVRTADEECGRRCGWQVVKCTSMCENYRSWEKVSCVLSGSR